MLRWDRKIASIHSFAPTNAKSSMHMLRLICTVLYIGADPRNAITEMLHSKSMS